MLFNSVFVNVDVTCFFKGPAIQVFQVLGAAYEMPFCPRLFCFFFFAADGLIWAGRPWWRWCFGRLVWMHHSYIGGSSFSSFGPFQAVEGGGGVACGLCSGSRAVCPGASPFEVYPAGKLPWHFTCGFDFRPSLWLPFEATFAVLKGLLKVPVGTMGLC